MGVKGQDACGAALWRSACDGWASAQAETRIESPAGASMTSTGAICRSEYRDPDTWSQAFGRSR